MQVDEQKGLKVALDSYKSESDKNGSSELQKLGMQFTEIFDNMKKDKAEVAAQLTGLTANLADDAKETHHLLAMQLDEQKGLKETLESYKIEEKLNDAIRLQQQTLSSDIDDFKKQRDDLLSALTGQTEASNNFRSELHQLVIRLEDIFNSLERGNDEISAQLTELTVHTSADAKELHALLNNAGNNVRGELQQLGSQLTAISNIIERD
jgi:chromosome segregation ATPase